MTLLSGKMTSASIDKFFSEVKKIINEALNTVPENKRPLWIPSYINTLKPRLLSLFPGDKFSVVPVKIVYKA
jgi:hypothetical protein